MQAGRHCVLLLEDTEPTRHALVKTLSLDFEVREAVTVPEAIEALDEREYVALLLDGQIGEAVEDGRTGLDVATQVRARGDWDTEIMLLTGHVRMDWLTRCNDLDVRYTVKGNAPALRRFLDRAVDRHLGQRRRRDLRRALDGLTDRQAEIVRLAAETGADRNRIAERLEISPRTYDTHVRHVLRKLGETSMHAVAHRFRPLIS